MIVETTAGKVAGATHKGVSSWLGLPFARAQRFGPPLPPAPWQDTRPADQAGAQCPQHFTGSSRRASFSPPGFSEDCLNLNIWAPEGAEPGSKPVFFWIHGGAFVAGTGKSYHGEQLARDGDMVVVTINYRLGVLGFVNFGAALDDPSLPSNLGLRDQIAALRWVNENIRAFGGDPDRVTIAGQSAGSTSVSLLMLAQEAWPYFRGAILQSGAMSLIHGQAHSRDIARRYLDLLGARDAEALRGLSLRRLFEVQAQINREQQPGIPAAPWFDGALLPPSLDAAQAAPTAAVPIIAGATREEIRLFEFIPGNILPTKWPELEAVLRHQLPPDAAERLLACYPRTKEGRRALASDLTFLMPTRNFAETHSRDEPTWFYRFDLDHPLVGPAHGLELTVQWRIPGILGAIARGGLMRGRLAALGERLRANWAHFVHHGKPLADWPRYEAPTRKVRLFGLSDKVVENPDAERFVAWGGRYLSPRDPGTRAE